MSLEERIVEKLEKRGLYLTTAESCTAGLLAGRIMNVSGASSVYKEGYITYANESKEKLLHVRHETLEQYGQSAHRRQRRWQRALQRQQKRMRRSV